MFLGNNRQHKDAHQNIKIKETLWKLFLLFSFSMHFHKGNKGFFSRPEKILPQKYHGSKTWPFRALGYLDKPVFNYN